MNDLCYHSIAIEQKTEKKPTGERNAEVRRKIANQKLAKCQFYVYA